MQVVGCGVENVVEFWIIITGKLQDHHGVGGREVGGVERKGNEVEEGKDVRVVRRGDGMQMWRPSPASCTVTLRKLQWM